MTRLRLGLLLSGEAVPLWVQRLLERTRALPEVEIAVVLILPEPARSNRLFDAYFKLDQHFYHPSSHPWQETSLPEIPALHGGLDQLGPQLNSLRLDILVNLALSEIPGSLPGLARFGVWSVRDGRSRLVMGSQPGWRELLDGELLTICELESVRLDQPAQILARAILATDPLSISRNQLRLLWRASALVPRALRKLSLLGEEELLASASAASPCKRPSDPSLIQLALLALRQASRKLAESVRKRFTFEQWALMAAPHSGEGPLDWDGFTFLAPPRDRSWADPFPVEHGGRVLIFIEEFERSTRRGYIACLSLDPGGKIISNTPVLERPYHLSYPFVFEHAGGWYMVPETGARRTVELYRCTRFPDQWVFQKTLLEDIHAVDATLLEHDGRWWMFANVVEDVGGSAWDSLHLFYADDPLSESWTPHPLNPVVADVRSARPAGRIFLRGGVLCRPSQVSTPRYGHALRLNRIDVLTTTNYAETCLETLIPPRGSNLLATHTYNAAGNIAVIDVQSRHFRF
jgi:hypothetical protein